MVCTWLARQELGVTMKRANLFSTQNNKNKKPQFFTQQEELWWDAAQASLVPHYVRNNGRGCKLGM